MRSIAEQIGFIPLPASAHEEPREEEASHDLLDTLSLKTCDTAPTLLEVCRSVRALIGTFNHITDGAFIRLPPCANTAVPPCRVTRAS